MAWVSTFSFIREAVLDFRKAGIQPKRSQIETPARFFLDRDTGRFDKYYISDHWRFVEKLAKLSYWSRRWIVPEVLLAQDIVLFADDEEIRWSELADLFNGPRKAMATKQEPHPIREARRTLETTIPRKMAEFKTANNHTATPSSPSLLSVLGVSKAPAVKSFMIRCKSYQA